MDFPLEMRTQSALGILGRLIFDWAENPYTLPPGHRIEGDRIIFAVDVFHSLMAAEGLRHGDPGDKTKGDYAVRADIREVELIRRSAGRASILLPEPEIVATCRTMTAPVDVPLASLYKDLAEGSQNRGSVRLSPARDTGGSAIYAMVKLDSDPLETFIFPNTVYYSCTQCL